MAAPSVRVLSLKKLIRKTCTPKTIKYQSLFPVQAPRALALLWSAAMHFTVKVCYTLYVNFMSCWYGLITWFLKLEAFNFSFSAVSLTCKIVLDTYQALNNGFWMMRKYMERSIRVFPFTPRSSNEFLGLSTSAVVSLSFVVRLVTEPLFFWN